MKAFQYKLRCRPLPLQFKIEHVLNDEGTKGWELVNFHKDTDQGQPCVWFCFKREIEVERKPTLEDLFQQRSFEESANE